MHEGGSVEVEGLNPTPTPPTATDIVVSKKRTVDENSCQSGSGENQVSAKRVFVSASEPKFPTAKHDMPFRPRTTARSGSSTSYHISAVLKRKFCSKMHTECNNGDVQQLNGPPAKFNKLDRDITEGTLNVEGISLANTNAEHTACDNINCDYCILFGPNMEALAEDLGMHPQAEACGDKVGQTASASKSNIVPPRSSFPTRSSSHEPQFIESCTHTARTRSQSVQVDRGPNGHLSQLDDTDL